MYFVHKIISEQFLKRGEIVDLKELDIIDLVKLINDELQQGLSVNGIIKKYNASKTTILNRLKNNNYKFNDELRKYIQVLSLEELQAIKIKELENELLEYKKAYEELKTTVQELKNEHKHNERGAGRKAKFTSEEIAEIKAYKEQGKSIRAIATMFNCSVGLVHKLINEG